MIDQKRDTRWSKAIKERDGHKCRFCGKSNNIEAAHIVPRGTKETRYILLNGITLCSNTGCRTHSLHHSLNKSKRELADLRIEKIATKEVVEALQKISDGATHDLPEVK